MNIQHIRQDISNIILTISCEENTTTKTQMAWACSPTWCVIARSFRRQDERETYEREKETTADEQHMRGIRNSKETSWRQMSVMCPSDGSHWPATTAEYQKKKNTTMMLLHWVSKNRTPVTFSNNFNNPGSISTNFGTKNRQLINTKQQLLLLW